MTVVLVPHWLLAWPHFTALLAGYLARLNKLPSEEVEKSWLRRHCRSAMERPEALQHLTTLEEVASLCNESAQRALMKKFEDTLPQSRTAWSRADDDRFLDMIVELAAYGWLRRKFPAGNVAYVAVGADRSPDLQVQTDVDAVGVECKNVHMSTSDRDVLEAGGVVSGSVSLSQEFASKLRATLENAMQQLAGYAVKFVFLNVSLDFGTSLIESEVGDAIRDMTPPGCQVVVFLNYGWSEPRWAFDGSS